MKIRTGFVSNSSSSSFVCDISGGVECGYDCSLSDVEMVRCTEGHTFNYERYEEVEDWVISDDNEDANYDLPKELCPICNGKAKPEIVKFMKSRMNSLGISAEDLK